MKKILTMKKVTEMFGSGHTKVLALKTIDSYVKEGEFASIIGPSGSGKNTFLTISGGLQTPASGEIAVNGRSLAELPGKKWADLRFKEVGFILRDSSLIPFLAVKEWSELTGQVTSKEEDSTRIDSLLQSLDIQSFKNSYPKDLSGGERQRVVIARALYNKPNLILADEPTVSLDTDHAYEVVKLLAKEAYERQKAAIMVTYDVCMVQWSDRVYRMEDGYLTKEEREKEWTLRNSEGLPMYNQR